LRIDKRKEGATLAEIAQATTGRITAFAGFSVVTKKLGLKVESAKSACQEAASKARLLSFGHHSAKFLSNV